MDTAAGAPPIFARLAAVKSRELKAPELQIPNGNGARKWDAISNGNGCQVSAGAHVSAGFRLLAVTSIVSTMDLQNGTGTPLDTSINIGRSAGNELVPGLSPPPTDKTTPKLSRALNQLADILAPGPRDAPSGFGASLGAFNTDYSQPRASKMQKSDEASSTAQDKTAEATNSNANTSRQEVAEADNDHSGSESMHDRSSVEAEQDLELVRRVALGLRTKQPTLPRFSENGRHSKVEKKIKPEKKEVDYPNESFSVAEAQIMTCSSEPSIAAEAQGADASDDIVDVYETFDNYEWLAGGSKYIGKHVRIAGVNEKDSSMPWEISGRVVGWLPAEANIREEDGQSAGAIYHIVHDDGDEEDLDEEGVVEALKRWDERDASLDGTIYSGNQKVVKGAYNLWRRYNMLTPSGQTASCTEAIDLHLEANTKISLWQENPKGKGSMSYSRYEKYKAATTFQEMLDLSAKKADLLHDYAKGFIKVAGLPDVVPLSQHGLVMSSKTVNYLSSDPRVPPKGYIGQRVTRRGTVTKKGVAACADKGDKVEAEAAVLAEEPEEEWTWEADGVIAGWLPASANDDPNHPGEWYCCLHDDGDEEDIDEKQVIEGIAAYAATADQRESRRAEAAAAAARAPLAVTSGASDKKRSFSAFRKWSEEEDIYAQAIIEQFDAGLLPLADGDVLIKHLSSVLDRQPRAIYRRFSCSQRKKGAFCSQREITCSHILEEAARELKEKAQAFGLTHFIESETSSKRPRKLADSPPSKFGDEDSNGKGDAAQTTTKCSDFSYRGVSQAKGGRWISVISIKGKKKHLGTFDTDILAAQKYDEIAKLHGRDLNFPSSSEDGPIVAEPPPPTESGNLCLGSVENESELVQNLTPAPQVDRPTYVTLLEEMESLIHDGDTASLEAIGALPLDERATAVENAITGASNGGTIKKRILNVATALWPDRAFQELAWVPESEL